MSCNSGCSPTYYAVENNFKLLMSLLPHLLPCLVWGMLGFYLRACDARQLFHQLSYIPSPPIGSCCLSLPHRTLLATCSLRPSSSLCIAFVFSTCSSLWETLPVLWTLSHQSCLLAQLILTHRAASDFVNSGLLLSEGSNAMPPSLTSVRTSAWEVFGGTVFRFFRQVVLFLVHVQLSPSTQSSILPR